MILNISENKLKLVWNYQIAPLFEELYCKEEECK